MAVAVLVLLFQVSVIWVVGNRCSKARRSRDAAPHFLGDLSGLWRSITPPNRGLTWDWWWWLVMLEDEEGRRPASNYDAVVDQRRPRVEVNGQTWRPQGRPGVDEHGGMALDGMVCAWWFDGQTMHDAVLAKRCSMVVLPGASFVAG